MMQFLDRLGLQNKILVTNAVLLLGAAVIVIFITMPSFDDIKKIREDINTQRMDLEERYKRSLSLKKLTENLKTIEPKIEKLDQVFISQNRELEFITALEEVAAQKNVSQKLSLGKTQPSGDKIYKKVPLQIQAQGSFQAVMAYLKNLEALNYYINIKSIALSSGGMPSPNAIGNNTFSTRVGIDLDADTYWR